MAVAVAAASAADPAEDRSGDVKFLLGVASPGTVVRVRGTCATGKQPAEVASLRALGETGLSDVVTTCIAALTRLGRDGTLQYVRDIRTSGTAPALSLDTGFVAGFHKREAADTLPAMAALRPVAERCLAQQETDVGLCYSVGYAYGCRSASGETVAER